MILDSVKAFKTCRVCGALFNVHQCRLCKNRIAALWRAKNPDIKAAQDAAYRLANSEQVRLRKALAYKSNAIEINARAKIWRIANPEITKARSSAYYAANSESIKRYQKDYAKKNTEKVNKRTQIWKKENPEKVSASSAARYARNSVEHLKKTAEWRKQNSEKIRIYTQNYQARKESSGEKLSIGLAEKLFLLQGGKCPCCKLPLGDDYHMDHIIPLKRGGPNNDANIQLLRQRCNNQKSAKDPLLFMQSRGFLL